MRGFCFIIIFNCWALSACNYRVLKEPAPDTTPGSFSESTTVDAAIVRDAVLNTCLRCHSGANLPTFTSFDEITKNIAKIQSEVMTNAMPPASSGYKPLTDCQKDLLQEWINEGLPTKSTFKVLDLAHCKQGTPTPPAAPPLLEMPVNYQTLTTRILQPRCLHCHNADSADPDAAEILLYPFDQLMTHKKFFGNTSADSKFLTVISRTDEERMPPPEDSGPLSSDEIEFIKRWLDAGHPEN